MASLSLSRLDIFLSARGGSFVVMDDVDGGLRKVKGEMGTEMLLKDIPSASLGLLRDEQQGLVEERRSRLVERGACRGGSAYWGHDSEEISGIRGAFGCSSVLLGRDSASEGLSRLVVDRGNPSLSPSVDEGSTFRHHISYYAGFDASLSSAAEELTDLGLLSRFRSIHIEDEIDVPAATKNVSLDSYAYWSSLGDVASASDLINDSFDEARTSLVQPQQSNPASRFPQECRSSLDFQFSLNSHPRGIYSEAVDSLYNGGAWSGLQENQSFSSWESPSDSAQQSLDAYSSDGTDAVVDLLAIHRHSFDSSDLWDAATPPISPQTVLTSSQLGCPLLRQHGSIATASILRSPRPYDKPHAMPLADIRGSIALVAKDQHGCRYLQRMLDEGSEEEKETIFFEIVLHVAELMVNPFGNYLVQKALDVCTEKQRLEIVSILTDHPAELVNIARNVHGTRALQKLIEVLKEEETVLIISAIRSSFLTLATDANGNHVLQRCLRHFSYEQSKFIFEAAATHCVEIATHRHGCCVLQQCIARSTGRHKENLLAQVSLNCLALAQDAYGNYAVQYILDVQNHSAFETLKSRFKGNYARLSMQKFSSNVIEKCLRVFDEAGRKMIVSELLSVFCFDLLMQDPYANYVIQSALLVCKGQIRSSLGNAIRSRSALRGNPYCRGIFNLVKK